MTWSGRAALARTAKDLTLEVGTNVRQSGGIGIHRIAELLDTFGFSAVHPDHELIPPRGPSTTEHVVRLG